MARNQSSPQTPARTATGVEFSPWPTEVENDDLWLGKLSFDVGAPLVTIIKDKTTYSLPSSDPSHKRTLEADFVSIDKSAVIRLIFQNVIAFRVLEENGLLELWGASDVNPRPASTTFRARGHKWSEESVLVFMAEGSELRFSYFVATDMHCLEVVCPEDPIVTNMGPALVTTQKPNFRCPNIADRSHYSIITKRRR